ncbi:MAG: helix-turn-helix domain-containing protein [Deltaproteobacteria bacterium]|nr:helix-turn-helix domain-containing protein [Deltaproteobacteria bacterium]MBW2615731.1 helix-turn-helix domain-containing protein [Deltaproteobacteria bacterium]
MSQKEHIKSTAKEASTSEAETQKSWKEEAGNDGKVSLKGAGIGDLFRNQREKMGLSHTRISKTTRIRPYILEALENENWEVLPSSVFVTGFIRSYARTLGLEQEKIVALYQKYVPADGPPARPLVEPPRSKKAPFVILIFLLLIMASAYYLWKEYPAHEKITTVPETKRAEGDKVKNLKDKLGVPYKNAQALSNEKKQPAAGPVSSPPDSSPARLNSTPEPGTQPSDMEPSEDLSEGRENPSQASIEQTPSREPVTVPVAGSDLLILKATVRERTYIRMVVDAREPKEYVFRAGSAPQWEAKEGFDVLIGNAGGIDFEFNGKKIQNLGRTGQVVRLRFPEDISSQ